MPRSRQYNELKNAARAFAHSTDHSLENWDHVDPSTRKAREEMLKVIREHEIEEAKKPPRHVFQLTKAQEDALAVQRNYPPELVAAAPELLAALKRLIHSQVISDDPKSPFYQAHQAIKRAEAAHD